MLVDGRSYRALWWSDSGDTVCVIDQRHLPHALVVEELRTVRDVFVAIRDMHVRGAPLIGASAACGLALAADAAASDELVETAVREAGAFLKTARPTAVNLRWAVDRVVNAVAGIGRSQQRDAARREAQLIISEEVERCRQIGEHGLEIVDAAARRLGRRVNILTHCNAGWLACVDYGTATAPIYLGHDRGLSLHVWVDETRPRNQGSRLTAWELGKHGVPHTVITDNAGGHLMQKGAIDMVIVGTDRTTRSGDVINKIGTYLKALAAADNGIPFYVALPSSSVDWSISNPMDAPIEERDSSEVHYIGGGNAGRQASVRITPESSPAANYAFDVTPSKYVTSFITERGVCEASEKGLRSLFPDAA